MRKLFFLFISQFFICPLYSQVGGGHVFEFLSLNTFPRSIALGGYLNSVIDGDLNNGIYNPAVINSFMSNKLGLNYNNYYDDIYYGDVGYCFNIRNRNIITSIKFINYGEFIETNEFGQEIGNFSAGEYVFSLGSNQPFLDSLIYVGANAKLAYSSLYQLNSIACVFDFGIIYQYPKKDVTASFLIQNLGYQLKPYYVGERKPLPLELSLGVSNKLEHMPLRWHLAIQHLESPDLGSDQLEELLVYNDNFGYAILRHIVFGAELLFHENVNILFGYNNRKRFEMIIEDRKGLVGFSCGIIIKINRFKFYYSRASHHYSGSLNSFGILTNLQKK